MTAMATSPTALSQAQQDRVREALRELRRRAQNQAELARLLGVKQQSISRALSPRGPIGIRLASAVATARGQPLEDLTSGRRPPRLFHEAPGWREAVEAVLREHRATPGAAAAVGRWPAFLDVERVDPKLVQDLVHLWNAWAPLPARQAAERAAEEAPRAPEITREIPIVQGRARRAPDD